MRMARSLETAVERIERADALDGAATRVQAWLHDAVPSGEVEDALHGAPLGHPLHPLLVQLPIGAWASALLADVLGEPGAARKLTAVGCLAALPAALAGGVDWMTTDGAARRVGLVHGAVNDAALVVFWRSWRARRRGRRVQGLLLSVVGTGLVSAGGWLGGHLAYSQAVGVDTTDFVRRQGRAAGEQPGEVRVDEPAQA
jgi:uncharacterized membrane protein